MNSKLFKKNVIYYKIYSETFWVPMMKRLWPMYFALPLEKRDVHVCSFEAIWSGNWAAAYFRYICKAIYKLSKTCRVHFRTLYIANIIILSQISQNFFIEIKEALINAFDILHL